MKNDPFPLAIKGIGLRSLEWRWTFPIDSSF